MIFFSSTVDPLLKIKKWNTLDFGEIDIFRLLLKSFPWNFSPRVSTVLNIYLEDEKRPTKRSKHYHNKTYKTRMMNINATIRTQVLFFSNQSTSNEITQHVRRTYYNKDLQKKMLARKNFKLLIKTNLSSWIYLPLLYTHFS